MILPSGTTSEQSLAGDPEKLLQEYWRVVSTPSHWGVTKGNGEGGGPAGLKAGQLPTGEERRMCWLRSEEVGTRA